MEAKLTAVDLLVLAPWLIFAACLGVIGYRLLSRCGTSHRHRRHSRLTAHCGWPGWGHPWPRELYLLPHAMEKGRPYDHGVNGSRDARCRASFRLRGRRSA